MKNIQFYFFWVLILFQSVTFSQTNVNGNVSGIWTITNSPFIVTNNLVLQPTDTLIINSGVEVRFDGYYRFDIFGTFFAVGTASDSIIFTRNDSTNWGSLNFSDASNDSSNIQYCIIEYGSSSGYDPYNGVINCFESSPTIANSTIRNNSQISFYTSGTNAQPLILANTFQNNSSGVVVESGAQPTIDGNVFNGIGILINASAIYINNSTNVVINDNNISINTGYGIYLFEYCFSTQITNNIIIANNNSGIYLMEHNDNVSIENNTISNNNGEGIYINKLNEGVVIDSNNISNNGSYGIDLSLSNDNVIITNNNINGNGNFGIGLSNYNDQAIIGYNVVSNNNNAGIYLGGGNYDVDIENNTFTNNGIYGIRVDNENTGVNILNNNITNHTNYGIRILGSIHWCNIIKNLIVDNGEYGIYFSVTGNNISVINNTIKGHDIYGLSDDTPNQYYSNNQFSAINNSITNNDIGIYLHNSGGNIAYNNSWNNITNDYAGSLPSGTGIFTIFNINSTICDAYYNISEDPLYTDTNNNDFTLQPGSPNISAGNPDYTDPDSTISDIGAFYFDTPFYMPEADFIGDTLSGNPLLNVNFTDLSQISDAGTPVNSWSWDFGDGSLSTEQNPAHTYQQSGNYTVTLAITDSIGFSDTEIKENYINIFATEVHNLDIGGDEDLQHLISHEPIITFDFFNTENELQTYYQVQISTDTSFSTIDMWDTGEVASSDTSIIYAGAALEDGTTYYLRVKVAAGSFWGDWSSLTFRMNTEPSTPVQVSPIANEVSGIPVVLKVINSTDAENDAITYSFNIFNDAGLTTKLDSITAVTEGIDTTSWQVTATLPDNGQYWWTVSANDGYEESVVSTAASFLLNISNDTPAAFTLLSPPDSSEVDTLNPLLVWESAVDPDPMDTVIYSLYFGNDIPNLQIVDVDTSNNYQIVSPLMDNTTYYWKVVATDLNGASVENVGGYWSFRVNTENDLPGDFSLLIPENGSMVTDLTPTFLWEVPIDPDDSRLISSNPKETRFINEDIQVNSRFIEMYDFYLGLDSNFTAVEPISVDTNQYTPFDNLAEDQLYYWKIIAFDDDGGNAVSGIWSFWTNSENSIPDSFDIVFPVYDEVLCTVEFNLTWNPSSDNDINDVVIYQVYLDTQIDSMQLWSTPIDTFWMINAEVEENHTYYWKVVAIDQSGATRENENGIHRFSINMENDPPSAVELISPDSVVVLTLTPDFHWTEAIDPDPDDSIHYELHWVKDGNDFVDSVLTDTNYAIPYAPLDDNSKFFWWVISMDRQYDLSHSSEAVFWTDTHPEPPLAFNTISPIDSSEDLLTEVEFIWQSTTDPDPLDQIQYNLVYATDWTDSSTYIWVENIPDTTVSLALQDKTEYFWIVEAVDKDTLITASNNGTPKQFVVGIILSTDGEDLIPEEFALHQNFPNPFNPVTTLRYDLPERSDVVLTVYNILGKQVRILDQSIEDPGFKSVVWDSRNNLGEPVSAGVYLYQIRAGDFVQTKKMILLK